MKIYPKPTAFDGAKFAARYGLNAIRGDFWDDGNGFLHVPDGLPDDPPIFDPPDPVVAVSPGVHVHHWPEMSGWIGDHKLEFAEHPSPHHECYYIVADSMVALDNFRAMPQADFQVGQLAYINDPTRQTFVVWNGTSWTGIRTIVPSGPPTVNVPNTVVGMSTSGIITVGNVGTANIVLTFATPLWEIPAVAISVSSNLCQVSVVATLTNITFKSNNNQINGKTISYICQ